MNSRPKMSRFDQMRAMASSMFKQRRKPNPALAISPADSDLNGKTVAFTGGTDGMGRVAVELLHKMGATVILLGRNEAKGQALIDELGSNVRFVHCDLVSLESVRSAASKVLADYPEIHVLVNNAGVNLGDRQETPEGFEAHWVINYLGSYLLTNLLLDRLQASAPARIVNVSSATEALGHINFDNLQLERNFSTGKAYSQAKLALNMFTIHLSRQLEGSGVTVNALNPGFIKSNLLRDLKGKERVGSILMLLFASPALVGADRIVRLAVSSAYEGVSGQFVFEDAARLPNPEALDDTIVERLMEVSRAQAGLEG
ncbi:MAG: SDR family NAD(P)-dependent oxidoreductase [bacterium]|nr:SDR family NAD(P)-dependent oxidoreductase [bacterium]